MIHKACGYASLYIATAEHEGDRPADQVTISIFRAVKNPDLFTRMQNEGTLVKGEVPGVYYVKGITSLPFQIVITGELEGEEYASFRALTDKAEEVDVERIIKDIGNEHDDTVREYYRALLRLIIEKNPKYIGIGKEDADMEDVLMEMVKDRVDEEKQELTTDHIKKMMKNLTLTVDQAMDALGIAPNERKMYAGLVNKAK